ncbi:MAG: cytochrome C [Verrucomicrobiales bacterium]
MPIYEFYSPETNKIYSFFARSLACHEKVPRCPEGVGFRMQKQVSRFAVTGRAKEEGPGDPFAGVDEEKMEALMSEMEHDMPDLDKENADPRQLGRFMRKMSDLLGDKAPPEMREMIRRLESGEEPEKLEEQFGDLVGDESADPFLMQAMQKLRHSARRPQRDPTLYEFSEYCDV